MLVSVVLAAGKGTRMRSKLPKVLHPLLGLPLLEHVLETTDSLAPSHHVVVVGYGHEEIKKAFPRNETRAGSQLVWALQEEQLGTAHAAHVGVEALRHVLDGSPAASVLVANGDLPLLRPSTLQGLLDTHCKTAADVTLLTSMPVNPYGYGRIARDARGALRDIVEEKDADEKTRSIPEVNVGAYLFRAAAFREFFKKIDRHNVQGELYLTDVAVKAAQAGRVVSTFTVRDASEIAQVNSRSELAQAAEILRLRLLEEYMDAGVTIDDPRTTYIEKGVKIGAETRILPFTVICRGVEIGEGCEIGPFAHLRAGTRTDQGVAVGNFVEIKNTRVGRRTKVKHLSYLGDGIVGEDVNIGAGTIFANYDGKTKSTTVVKDRAFVGSGTVLVAPVTVGAGAITGAGSVVLKNRDVADGEVVAGVPARSLNKKP